MNVEYVYSNVFKYTFTLVHHIKKDIYRTKLVLIWVFKDIVLFVKVNNKVNLLLFI